VFFATTINYLDRNVLGLHRGLGTVMHLLAPRFQPVRLGCVIAPAPPRK